MPDPTSAILASRLGRLAGRGRLRAWLVARFLPDNIGQATFNVVGSPESIRSRASALLANRGELLDPRELHLTLDVIVAVVGAVWKEGLLKERGRDEVAARVRRHVPDR